jgi:hypothetical protein
LLTLTRIKTGETVEVAWNKEDWALVKQVMQNPTADPRTREAILFRLRAGPAYGEAAASRE